MDINPQKLKNRVDDWIVELDAQANYKLLLKDIRTNIHLLIDQQVEEEQEQFAKDHE